MPPTTQEMGYGKSFVIILHCMTRRQSISKVHRSNLTSVLLGCRKFWKASVHFYGSTATNPLPPATKYLDYRSLLHASPTPFSGAFELSQIRWRHTRNRSQDLLMQPEKDFLHCRQVYGGKWIQPGLSQLINS
jgi:hypothetical protein